MDPKRIFIPKECIAGFVNRSDTYSGKLGYVIYKDETNKIRKENSLNSWRNKNIDLLNFSNVPTEGFIINRSVGGKGWSNRNSYCRIYDPRGFEFEISTDNLLYILESNEIGKGKNIKGKFVYSWIDKELILLPIDSVDYKDAKEYSDKQFEFNSGEKITVKSLVPGCTYKLKYVSTSIKDVNNKPIDTAIFIGNIPLINSDLKHSKSQLIFHIPHTDICFISTLNNIMYKENINCDEKLANEIKTLLGYTAYTKEFWFNNLSKISGYRTTCKPLYSSNASFYYYPRKLALLHTDGKIYQFFPELVKEASSYWYRAENIQIINHLKDFNKDKSEQLQELLNKCKWEPIFKIEKDKVQNLNIPFRFSYEYKLDDINSIYHPEFQKRSSLGPQNNENNVIPSMYLTAYQIEGYESLSLAKLALHGFFANAVQITSNDWRILNLPTKINK